LGFFVDEKIAGCVWSNWSNFVNLAIESVIEFKTNSSISAIQCHRWTHCKTTKVLSFQTPNIVYTTSYIWQSEGVL